MTKQEQIEEIARIICGRNKDGICVIDKENCDNSCSWSIESEKIYNAGYRKGETISYQAMIDSSYIYQINQLEESLYKIRTETAKEIYGLAVDYYDGSEAFDLFLQAVKERYGVEVE